MADEDDPNASAPDAEAGRERRSPRRQPLTPELRKFLGPGRSWHDREAAKEEAAERAQAAPPTYPYFEPTEAESSPPAQRSAPIPPQSKGERRRSAPSAPAIVPDQKISRAIEMQTVAIVVGGIILLGTAFYAGTKARVLKTFFARNKLEFAAADAKKFPGLSAEELVEQALAAERLGNWHDAVERLLVAKRRDPRYHDVIFHAARLCYDHGDFDGADRLFERAIAFGDQVDTANYFRGQIAVGRNDLPAAEQFFEAAITAEPFTPGYYYYLGETLRREQRPKEAVACYEQAATRTVNEQDAVLCRFKARIARSETADHPQLQTEVDQKRASGLLTADWLLTDAALKIRLGQFAEAAQLIQQARPSDDPRSAGLFASAVSDMLFTGAANNHPEIAEACRISGAAASPSFNPTILDHR